MCLHVVPTVLGPMMDQALCSVGNFFRQESIFHSFFFLKEFPKLNSSITFLEKAVPIGFNCLALKTAAFPTEGCGGDGSLCFLTTQQDDMAEVLVWMSLCCTRSLQPMCAVGVSAVYLDRDPAQKAEIRGLG